ncbi:hypothetical protein BJF86_04740 [Serinicoccus sp. CNJ-927]|uniref:hypothetical protein n=1 Tax=Serinicoccus sp. CNJ-927 TaxID=1904970 RepID=UPI00095EC312|nr:hypothetical protein [Serinicoccus sp. CNJ-927]OLT40128.1 hypothetical protein BJF86_04740 [Serinicoccus sp. CNJ-927]
MGLREVLARSAARHAHVLVVEVPGWDGLRMATERAVLERGWRLACSPADADVLVVCGTPGPRLAEAVDLVWEQLPGPRVRIVVLNRSELTDALPGAHAGLLDDDHHRRDARDRPGAPDLLASREAEDEPSGHEGHSDHADHGAKEGSDEPSGHEGHSDHADYGANEGSDEPSGDEDHGNHADHGGHDMEMSPDGIPLAEGGEDRDGLEMDVLAVRLGPVLPHWPAGLVLHCSLQGDVLTGARAELLGAECEGGDAADPRTRALDRVVSVLALAGWDDAAERARRIRDVPPTGDARPAVDRPTASPGLARLRRRVRRSRMLRWSLRGLGPLTADDVRRLGLPEGAVGDAYDRLLHLLDDVDEPAPPGGRRAVPVDAVVDPVVGLDLAAARLVLAGLDLGTLSAAPAPRPEATRG